MLWTFYKWNPNQCGNNTTQPRPRPFQIESTGKKRQFSEKCSRGKLKHWRSYSAEKPVRTSKILSALYRSGLYDRVAKACDKIWEFLEKGFYDIWSKSKELCLVTPLIQPGNLALGFIFSMKSWKCCCHQRQHGWIHGLLELMSHIHHPHAQYSTWLHEQQIHQHEARFTENARHVVTMMYGRHYACQSYSVRVPGAVPASWGW